MSSSGPWHSTFCRFAAKARFDNRPPSWGEVSKGRAQPLPFGRFQGEGIFKGRGKSKSLSLKWCSLDTFFRQGKKVSRRRQKAKDNEKPAGGAVAPAHGLPTHTSPSGRIFPHMLKQETAHAVSCHFPGLAILADHRRDLAQQRGLPAINRLVILVLRQQPHLAVAAAEPLHRGLVPSSATTISPL